MSTRRKTEDPAPPQGRFKKATRGSKKLRMAIDGPAKSGKTTTALRLATALGKRIAVIDSEHGSASLYQGEVYDGVALDFEVAELTHFDPEDYVAALADAAAEGFDVIIIDSLSHAWDGVGGALDQVDQLAAEQKGNTFSPWKTVSPKHRRMIEAILASPCHVIATMRSKMEYAMERNQYGKIAPRKVGLAPVQRQGTEYEFDIFGSMDQEHALTISGTRCRAIDGLVVPLPGPEFMRPVVAWLAGERVEPVMNGTVSDEQAAAEQVHDDHQAEMTAGASASLLASIEQQQRIDNLRVVLNFKESALSKWLQKKYDLDDPKRLTVEQAAEVILTFTDALAKQEAAAAQAEQQAAAERLDAVPRTPAGRK